MPHSTSVSNDIKPPHPVKAFTGMLNCLAVAWHPSYRAAGIWGLTAD